MVATAASGIYSERLYNYLSLPSRSSCRYGHAAVVVAVLTITSSSSFAQDIQWGAVQAGKQVSNLRVPGHVIPQEGALSIESARVTGRITEILKHEGEPVAVNDPLFAITSAECISLVSEMQVAKKQGLEDLLEASHRRERELGVRAYEDHCEILATHAGTLMKRGQEVGAVFNIGDNLATIVDVHRLTIELAVSEPDVPRIQPGQAVRVHIGARSSLWLETTVQQVLPTIDPVTRTTNVRLTPVPMPPGTTMDAFVVGVIEIGGSRRALRVPRCGRLQPQRPLRDEADPTRAEGDSRDVARGIRTRGFHHSGQSRGACVG